MFLAFSERWFYFPNWNLQIILFIAFQAEKERMKQTNKQTKMKQNQNKYPLHFI